MLLNCHIGCYVLGLLCVGVWVRLGWSGIRVAGRSTTCCASAGSPDASVAELLPNSNTQQTKNVTATVVVQQHSREILKMGIFMPKTC